MKTDERMRGRLRCHEKWRRKRVRVVRLRLRRCKNENGNVYVSCLIVTREQEGPTEFKRLEL